MALPKVIELMEVCPRDGWQNYPIHISKENKIKYIKKMIDYGAKRIDVTSFVNPKYVPQMDDSAEVVAGTLEYAKNIVVFLMDSLSILRALKMPSRQALRM